MILYRYIIKEHFAPFVFGLSLIVFIFLMNHFTVWLGKIAGKGIPIMTIIEFFFLSLAWILALAVPMAVLIATLSAFGRMSGDSEITALRASGISPWQMIRPSLAFGAFVMVWVLYFNNFVLPDMNHRTKLLQVDFSRKKPTFALEPNVYNFSIPNYVLYAKEIDQEQSTLEDITIYDEHNPRMRTTITADRGKLEFVPSQEAIVMTLNDGEMHRPKTENELGYEYTTFDSALIRLKMPGMAMKREKEGWRGDREMTVVQLLQRIDELKKQETPYNAKRISQHQVEIHKKFSIPAACLVFVFIGAPLGMLTQRGGLGVSGTISLLFFVIYWTLLRNGEIFADRGKIDPAISMWVANVVMAIIGIWFLWIARRNTTLPGVRLIGNFISRIFSKSSAEDEADRIKNKLALERMRKLKQREEPDSTNRDSHEDS